jgi:RNA polymerase sigma-70 factor (ECF subfamily)
VTLPWNDRRDKDLLARMAGGDREALGELYEAHADALFGHALALTRRREDAEDLVQEAFVKLADLGVRLLGVRRPGAYLHRMVRLAFIDRQRHRAVAEESPLDGAGEPAASGVGDAERVALEFALARLPFEQREVMLLHVIEGLTFREVAARVGAPMWTVASRYRLGVNRLRAVLGTGR